MKKFVFFVPAIILTIFYGLAVLGGMGTNKQMMFIMA